MEEPRERLESGEWRDVAKLAATAVVLTALIVAVYFAARHWHLGRDGTTALFVLAVALVYFVGRRL